MYIKYLLIFQIFAVLINCGLSQFLPAIRNNQLFFNPGVSQCAQQCESVIIQQQSCLSAYNSQVYGPYYANQQYSAITLTPQITAILPATLNCFCQAFTTIQMQFSQCLTQYVCSDAAVLLQSIKANFQPMCTSVASGLPNTFDYGSIVNQYLPFATGNALNQNGAYGMGRTVINPKTGQAGYLNAAETSFSLNVVFGTAASMLVFYFL